MTIDIKEAYKLTHMQPPRNEPLESIDRLNKTEYQRWIPIFGFYRMAKDIFEGDSKLLFEIHSDKYNITNIIYNTLILSSTTMGVTFGLFSLLN